MEKRPILETTVMFSETRRRLRNLRWAYRTIFVTSLIGACASPETPVSFREAIRMNLAPSAPPGAAPGSQPNEPEFPVLDESAELTDYLTYGALYNPGLQAAFNRWKAALERVPQVRFLPDPMFGYSYMTPDREPRHAYELSQTFPWFGKLDLRGEVELAAANSEGQRFRAAQLNLVFQVKNIYYEYYYLFRRIAVTEGHLELLASLEKIAVAKYKTGTATHPDVINFQIEIAELEDRLRRLHDLRGPMMAAFNAALGRPPDVPIPWPRVIPEESVSFSDDQLVSWLRKTNPRLKVFRYLAQKEAAALRLAKKDYFPDVTVGVMYDDNQSLIEEGKGSGTRGGNRNKLMRDDVGVIVSMNLPIWHRKYRAAERVARSRLHAVTQELRDEENNLIAALKMAAYKFRDAGRRINLYRDILIGKAEQSFHVTQQAYVTASASYLLVIDIQRTLLEFKLALERAVADRAQSLAELEMLVGLKMRREAMPDAQEGVPDRSENRESNESHDKDAD